MAKSQKKFAAMYDQLMFAIWDLTIGMGGDNHIESFKLATRMSRFIRSLCLKKASAEASESQPSSRRGDVIPDAVLDAWIWNLLEDCRYQQVPPPRALLDVLYYRLKCTHRTRSRKVTSPDTRAHAIQMLEGGQSLRDVAEYFAVNASTVLRWKEMGPEDFKWSEYQELMKATQLFRFTSPWRNRPDSKGWINESDPLKK